MGSRQYFYLAHRDGDKIKHQYVGSKANPVVAVLYREDRLRKAEAKAQRKTRDAEREWQQQIDSTIEQRRDQLTSALKIWLRVRGYIIDRDGTWRRSRSSKTGGSRMPATMTKEDFDELVVLAEKGHPQALESLRELIASDRETWRPFGDLTEHVKRQLLDSMTRGNIVARESLNLRAAEVHQELLGDHTSPIRKLAVDQVMLCWLDLHRQTAMVAEPRDGKTETDFLERRLAKAQKRYRDALEFLNKLDRFQESVDDRSASEGNGEGADDSEQSRENEPPPPADRGLSITTFLPDGSTEVRHVPPSETYRSQA